jgi:hypothetical protein
MEGLPPYWGERDGVINPLTTQWTFRYTHRYIPLFY